MKVLLACEESQAVCKAFRKRGHEAYSCDIQECSGGHPEWHIWGDVTPLLNGNCEFTTMDKAKHKVDGKWDLIIAFPPFTHLACSGAPSFEAKRKDGRQRKAIEFFMSMLNADCDHIAVENPLNILSGYYTWYHFPDLAKKYGLPIAPGQTIQPYMFGDPHRKTTNLWLKGLPKLIPTNVVEPVKPIVYQQSDHIATYDPFLIHTHGNRGTSRSKTFPGIAEAMAEQWGGINDI